MELKKFYDDCKVDSIVRIKVAHEEIYVQVTWIDENKKSESFFADVLTKDKKHIENNDYPIKYVIDID